MSYSLQDRIEPLAGADSPASISITRAALGAIPAPRVDQPTEGEVVKPGDVQLRIIARTGQRVIEPICRRSSEAVQQNALLAILPQRPVELLGAN